MKKSAHLKYLALILIFSSLILVITNNYNNIKELFIGENSLQYMVNFIAIASGVSGIIIGFKGIRTTNLESVKEYFQQGDDEQFIVARRFIYGSKNPEEILQLMLSEDNSEDAIRKKGHISIVLNFYHLWGLMVRKRYLPIWVFKGASGRQLINIYPKLEGYILVKRYGNENIESCEEYGENITWLYSKIKTKYKYEHKKVEQSITSN